MIGTYALADISSSIVDLTAPANSRAMPAPSGVGHGHREAVSA